MASTALLGFLKGASGAALDSITAREKEEAERRKMELAAAINHEYFTKQELFKEGLPSNVEKRKQRQREFERAEELHPLQVEAGHLGLDSTRQEMELARNRDARADRLTDAQVDSYRASANRSRSGSSSKEGDDTDLAGRIAIANAVTSRLAESGLDTNEVLAARSRMLEAARQGRGLDWFVEFERSFMDEMRPSVRIRDNDSRMEQIRKSLDTTY